MDRVLNDFGLFLITKKYLSPAIHLGFEKHQRLEIPSVKSSTLE